LNYTRAGLRFYLLFAAVAVVRAARCSGRDVPRAAFAPDHRWGRPEPTRIPGRGYGSAAE